jgi:hypothetical protein
MLVDGQFQKQYAEELVKQIKDRQKPENSIYFSQ